MNCPQSQHLILEALDGSLHPVQQSELQAHLQTCGECRRFRQSQHHWDAALRHRLAPVRASSDLGERILVRVRAVKDSQTDLSKEQARSTVEAEFQRWCAASRRLLHAGCLPAILDLIGLAAILLALGLVVPDLVLGRLTALPAASGGGSTLAQVLTSVSIALPVLAVGAWITRERGQLPALLRE